MDPLITQSPTDRPERLEVVHRRNERFYELLADGTFAGLLVYGESGQRLVFTHTFIADGYRGRGLATFMIRGALDDIRAAGQTITNYCPVLDRFIEKNPEYLPLLDPASPGKWSRQDHHLRSGTTASVETS